MIDASEPHLEAGDTLFRDLARSSKVPQGDDAFLRRGTDVDRPATSGLKAEPHLVSPTGARQPENDYGG